MAAASSAGSIWTSFAQPGHQYKRPLFSRLILKTLWVSMVISIRRFFKVTRVGWNGPKDKHVEHPTTVLIF
jgi:hypothetical protein